MPCTLRHLSSLHLTATSSREAHRSRVSAPEHQHRMLCDIVNMIRLKWPETASNGSYLHIPHLPPYPDPTHTPPPSPTPTPPTPLSCLIPFKLIHQERLVSQQQKISHYQRLMRLFLEKEANLSLKSIQSLPTATSGNDVSSAIATNK